MNKYFIAFLSAFLFLAGCDGDKEQSDGNQPNQTTGPNASESGAGGDVSAGMGDESWVCVLGRTEVKYFLNHSPTATDAVEGKEGPQKRICELSETFQGNTKVLFYAHIEKDFCSKKLKEEMDKKKAEDENWKCYKT